MIRPLVESRLRIAFDERLTVLSVDDGIERLLGFGHEDFTSGRVVLKDRIHTDDADIARILFSLPAEDTSGTFNFRLRHADGQIRCVRGEYQKHAAHGGREPVLDLLLQDAKGLWRDSIGAQPSPNFRALMENTDDYIFFKDRNHVFTDASQNILHGFNIDGEHISVLGKTDYDVFPEKYADIYYRLEKKVFAGVPVAAEVHQSQTPEGKLAWLDNRKYPIKDDKGVIIGLFGVVRDVTEHKRVEQAQKEAEAEYQTIFECAVEGIFRTTPEGRLLLANEAAVRILGYDSLQDLRNSIQDVRRDLWFDANDREYYLRECLANPDQALKGFECRFKRKDGTEIWVLMNGSLVLGDDGTLLSLNGFISDITKRKLAETKLRESIQALNEAQQIAGVGSYVTDINAGIWTSSPALDQIFGIDTEYDRSVDGWALLVHPDDREGMLHHFLEEVVEQRRPFDRIYRIVRNRDGAVRWVHGLGRLEFDAEGRPVTMIGTVQDITEQRQAEDALRESEESLRQAQRIAGIGSFVTDVKSGKAKRSEVLLELFGVDKDYEPSMAGWVALTHPDDREKLADNLASVAAAGGGPFLHEFRIIRPSDGAVRWMQTHGQLELDELGNPKIYRGAVQDITERRQAEATLRESRELLRLFIEHAPAGLAMFDREMRYVAASRRWLEMHALIDQEVIGQSEYDVFPEIPESWREEHRRAMAGEVFPADERYIVRPGGVVQWIRREMIPWRSGDGGIGGIIIFSDDITHQREAEERLRLAASVFTNAREGITITDPDGNILEVNDMFTRITGYTREEAIGQNPRILKSGLQSEEFYSRMWRSLQEEDQWSGEIWNRTKTGEVIAETLTINAVRDTAGRLLQYVALFSDVTELKEHERQIEHVTYFDALTSLPNRVLLADRLRQAMTLPSLQEKLLAVAYLDLDGFKRINDGNGHTAGDRLLTALAFNMKCALRKGDTLARLGGDEFVAVLLDLDDAAACIPVLNRLLAAASDPVQVGNLSLNLTASIGVAFYRQKEEVDADSLLRQSDQAMYQAKLAGGNRFHIFDPEHDEVVRGRHENLEHIRQALAAQEFVLHFQPKVNMRSGEVVGAEALIRWQHPERGLLPPGMFLPVIEDHPLAIELGEWVIETALAQVEKWRDSGLDIPVSVNVAAIQLQHPEFVDRLGRLLVAHPRIRPFDLEIEVLETSALQDVVQTSQVLKACQEIGVSFAIDDFGTGYSSLTYLKRLPASILKIDKSFVCDMLEDPENLNILEGILGLGSAFHRQVIAEGVETLEHGLMLLRLGCDLAQGYGIARPMPAKDLPGWVSTWRPDPRWTEAPPVHPGNRTLLYAGVEHRAWIAAFDSFLQGKRHSPPVLDQRQCRFGAWLDTEGQAGRNQHAAYRAVDRTHRKFHALAADIIASQAQGRTAEGLAHLGDLHALGDDLQAQLEILMHWC